MIVQFLLKLFIYGCVGLVIEVFFTGLHSIILMKDKNAVCRTSLWVLPIYGGGAIFLSWLKSSLDNAFIFVPLAVVSIFALEFISGWLLRQIKIKAWDYSHAKFGIMGLIRLDYLPFWAMVAIGFDSLSDYISKILEIAGNLA